MPKVDVIVPAYNAARFLRLALDSVEAQTFPDWRIVLVNDGSTDGTGEIAASYAERLGERFLYIEQVNRGMSAARNAGIHASDSDYIALLDADDVWLPERLEESVRFLDARQEAGLAYGFVSCIDDSGKIISTHDRLVPEAEGRIARAIYTRQIDLPCVTVTVRRSALIGLGGFDETMRATEDRDLWLRIAQKSEVVRIPRIIALYRRSAGSMTNDGQHMFDGQMRFIEKHRGSEGCDDAARTAAISSVHRQRAETLGSQGRTVEALRHAVRALALRPASRNNLRTLASILLRRG